MILEMLEQFSPHKSILLDCIRTCHKHVVRPLTLPHSVPIALNMIRGVGKLS